MKRAFLLSLFLAAPASAQVCGPLTFVIGPTGSGCAPFGGAIPTLSAALSPSASVASCPVVFTLVPGPSPTPIGIVAPAFLILGASDPVLDLTPAGLPGCTLRAFPDVILPMPATGGGLIGNGLTVPVPPDPALIGGTAFAQGVLVTQTPGVGTTPRLSNGVSVSIF